MNGVRACRSDIGVGDGRLDGYLHPVLIGSVLVRERISPLKGAESPWDGLGLLTGLRLLETVPSADPRLSGEGDDSYGD